ncbi:MAG: hypothetical protein OEM96_05085 [Gemmatimonadota bacterium]|nr:hypothetical protein [Gemmatimonadota bacterium]
MRRTPILILATLALLLPAESRGQDVASMVVRVQADGAPVADVPVVVFRQGDRRVLATTAASGLAVVDLGGSRLQVGSRVSAYSVRCGDALEVMLVPAGGELPVAGDSCERNVLGSLTWGRDERLLVTLGGAPAMRVTASDRIRSSGTGFRVQLGPAVSTPGGSELDGIDAGFGGEVQVGVDGVGGPGVGAGVGFTKHGLTGADESMSHWSVFAEPRYTFGAARPGAHPYVAGRLAYTVFNPEFGAGLLKETGFAFGAGAGVVFPAFGPTQFDLWTRFTAVSVDVSGFADSKRSGSDWRLGGSLRF